MGRRVLTDLQCRKAAPGPTKRKLSDSGGLYLLVSPTGHKSWNWKYRFAGKERRLVLGTYPAVSLTEAREARDAAKKLQSAGTDPGVERKQRQAATIAAAASTFREVAMQWHRQQARRWTDRYSETVLQRLKRNAFPHLGSLPVAAITPALVLKAIRAIEARDAPDMARRVRQHMSGVFVYAIGAGLVETDPSAIIQSALQPKASKRRPAALKIEHAREVLRHVEGQADAEPGTKLASRLLALTVVRPGIVRLAEPHEFEDLDGKEPVWRVPAAKMKLTRARKEDATFEFIVPLAREAVETVKAAMALSAGRPYLFPSARKQRQPITDSTISKLYRTAGFRGRHVPHGWRASFSTVMNELAAKKNRPGDRAVIDLMLAHVDDDVEAAYNRAAYMPRRRQLAQLWADMLLAKMPSAEDIAVR